ncbi:hypothetical protein H2200_008244 [Cladophialophora chaetospira]|uniref:SigF-like NTF2-like domain-containing protein n=1 Tax=Cladophialophora chaetospira TaxID=386627 RepID=A0AA38X5K9_9EURO|nr:hypothetical protein H2200_008244 [Cladophialophora chaetospira]
MENPGMSLSLVLLDRALTRVSLVKEIPSIIKLLCTAPPDTQRAVIETFFTPDASFTHPFCRTGSFAGSIWLIVKIYRWYKILSPHIDVAIDGVAFDEKNLRLYVSLHQSFKLWIVPFYNAPVKLVTVLQLTTNPTLAITDRGEIVDTPNTADADQVTYQKGNGHREASESASNDDHWEQEDRHTKVEYWIQSQNDLYQTTEWIKFLVPWGAGVLLLVLWQFYATLLCVIGAGLYDRLASIPEKLYRRHFEIFDNDNKEHPHLGAD